MIGSSRRAAVLTQFWRRRSRDLKLILARVDGRGAPSKRVCLEVRSGYPGDTPRGRFPRNPFDRRQKVSRDRTATMRVAYTTPDPAAALRSRGNHRRTGLPVCACSGPAPALFRGSIPIGRAACACRPVPELCSSGDAPRPRSRLAIADRIVSCGRILARTCRADLIGDLWRPWRACRDRPCSMARSARTRVVESRSGRTG